MKKFWWWTLTLAWAGIILYLTTIPDFQPSNNGLLSWLLSNGGHFFFFGVQAAILSKTLIHSPSATDHRPLIVTTLYGFAIELIQRGIPSRSFSVQDLALDALGAFVFMAFMRKYGQ